MLHTYILDGIFFAGCSYITQLLYCYFGFGLNVWRFGYKSSLDLVYQLRYYETLMLAPYLGILSNSIIIKDFILCVQIWEPLFFRGLTLLQGEYIRLLHNIIFVQSCIWLHIRSCLPFQDSKKVIQFV